MIFRTIRTVFESHGGEETRDTFKGELNYEAGKLFYMMLVSFIAWLHYIPTELKLHQFPVQAICVRVGLSVISVLVIALKFTKHYRQRPGLMFSLVVMYMNAGAALVAATAGEYASPYIGGIGLVLMITIFAPVTLKAKILNAALSLTLFFTMGALFGLDYSNYLIRYAINDLLTASFLCVILSYILNDIKFRSWERRQQLKAASKTKSDFLAKMSHEIRTPMNAITGMADLALRENMSPASREHVLTIKQAGASLLSIINDILDLSKIESGKLEIVNSDYELSSLVNDVVSIIRMRVVNSTVRFVVNIDSKIPNKLVGDEIRMRQIMLNILSNAVKYTVDGFISLVINCEKAGDETVNLTIEVADTGKGIKPEDIEKLFSDFVRVDTTSNKGIEGTGLGLAITKNLLSAMGGNIGVASEYGKGSTFTVTLPQKVRSREPFAVVDNPEEKSVLVYERRDIYSYSMIRTIENLDVSCACVRNDNELRDELKSKDYPFIFVNYRLLENVKKVLSELKLKPKVVLLNNIGDTIADKSLSVIAMPAHSILVANVLNGVSDSFSYSADESAAGIFCAPDARVLVVDDINTNLKVAAGLLSPYKMQVDLVLSGAQAVTVVMERHYDLVFMDHMMPGMDGVRATGYIRKLGDENPHLKTMPIVALTANAVSGTREMFLQNGFDDFLSKPIDIARLNAILEKWIPREKQMPTAEDSNAGREERIDIAINGIDVKLGMARSGGTLDGYLQMLAVFRKDAVNIIDGIKKSLEANDLTHYITQVHGLKSAAANIGAAGLSEFAKDLETAGKREDRALIDSHTPKLIKHLESSLNDIDGAISAEKKKSERDGADIDKDALKTALNALKAAMDEFDPGAIKAAVRDLRRYENAKDTGDTIESILQDVLSGGYDEANAAAEALLEKL